MGETSFPRKYNLFLESKGIDDTGLDEMEHNRRSTRWDPEIANIPFAYVPWEQFSTADLTQQSFSNERSQVISRDVHKLKSSTCEEHLLKNLALLVYGANRMEGTIPAQMEEGATMVKIMDYMSAKLPEPPVTAWCSEGGREMDTPSSDRQLYQSIAAVKFLLVDNRHSPLSVKLIVETHRLMMENSYNLCDHGRIRVALVVGSFRTKEVNAGFYQFVPATAVARATTFIVREYNKIANHQHPIQLATYLFYELITIHPFENGNGRLCRLLLAWSLMRDGLPFAVNFSSGHRSRRQHYMHAINTARSGSRGELNVILLLSIEWILSNYLENERVMQLADVVTIEEKN